ncbi:MAG: diguanylate cyclase [Planctomycetes bacterium]|nr:diguanylate cyclase [Planctomycetota bacterium]
MAPEGSLSPSALEPGSERVFQELFARSPDGMIVADERGMILWANSAAMLWLESQGKDSDRLPESLLERDAEIRVGDDRLGESRSQEFIWCGEFARLICIRDVSNRHARERELRHRTRRLEAINANLDHLAHVDPLTAAENRRGLERLLQRELERARRDGSHLTALLIDIDDFKDVNDTWGHFIADRVLVHITRVFRSILRPQDIVGRIGGDEFLIVMPDTREAEGLRVAERLRAAVAGQPQIHGDQEIRATVSVGLCPIDLDRGSVAAILADARLALSRGKVSGKNRVTSTKEASREHEARLGFLSLLERGHHLDAVLLPVLRLEDEAVVGHEILSRGPEGPFEMPGDMFRACLDESMSNRLDLICLEGGLRLGSRLDEPRGRLHLNMLSTTILSTSAEELLELFPADAADGRYVIEISEQHMVGDPSRLAEKLLPLRRAGIRLAIDDVGFGRSSLETLVILEPEIVKIARRYVGGAAANPGLARSLERLIRVAKALGAEVIAEGIETEEDRQLVRGLGVEFGQGFLWGQPRRP